MTVFMDLPREHSGSKAGRAAARLGLLGESAYTTSGAGTPRPRYASGSKNGVHWSRANNYSIGGKR